MNTPGIDDKKSSEERRLWEAYRRGPAAGAKTGCPGDLALASYLDGRAGRRERRLLEAHVAECVQCRDALAELRGLLATEPQEAPAGVVERAKALVGAEEREATAAVIRPSPAAVFAPLRLSPFGWAAACAAVAVACAAGYLMGQDALLLRGEATTAVSARTGPSSLAGPAAFTDNNRIDTGAGI